MIGTISLNSFYALFCRKKINLQNKEFRENKIIFLLYRHTNDDGRTLAVASMNTNEKDAKQIQTLRLSEMHAKIKRLK